LAGLWEALKAAFITGALPLYFLYVPRARPDKIVSKQEASLTDISLAARNS
jgi:hypothetical protein